MKKEIAILCILTLLLVLISSCENISNSVYEEKVDIDEQIQKIEDQLKKEAGEMSDGEEVVGEEVPQEVTEPINEIKTESVLKTLVINETELVKLNVNYEDDGDVKITYSAPLDTNGEWQTNYGDAGEYKITITLDDGEFKTTQEVNLIVNKVNRPPKILDITLG